MAELIHKGRGPCKVMVAFDAGHASLELLGYALDMPSTTYQAFWHDVHGDQHGGPQGPPIDIQYLGEIVRIRCELSKFDIVQARKVKARRIGAVLGIVNDTEIGQLAFQDDAYIRVALNTPNGLLDENFGQCIVREAIELTRGTKFSTFVCEFEAHRKQSSGVYTDDSTS